MLIHHLPCHRNMTVSTVVYIFCCDDFTSRTVRCAALTHCHAESVDINTSVELCCLIHNASLLPETLAVWPERDVARLPCAGKSLGWLGTLNTPGYLQKKNRYGREKGIKLHFMMYLKGLKLNLLNTAETLIHISQDTLLIQSSK